MKKKVLLSLMLILSMMIYTGCSNNKNQEVVEEPNTEIIDEVDTEVTENEEYNFEGRTMNVVTTSEKYVALFDAFSEEVNANVEFLSMSSGEVIARIEAEGGKPMADLWFGGGLDAFMSAKDSELLEQYVPMEGDKIDSRFIDVDNYWLSKGLTVVGFLVNEQLLQEKNLEVPTTWAELADPKYKDEIIMSNPAISGTNYGAVKGILDMMGEEAGWEYLRKLNDNIPFYGKRGKDPEEKVVAGEFAIGIIPADKSSFDVAEKNNLDVIYPEDGIPWVPEGVAIFKGGDGVDIAKAFVDFMLRDENQKILSELDGKDSAQMIKKGIEGYDLGLPEDKLIDQDISTFGTMREDILSKWEVLTQGK